ncbi:hypothetical protein PCIT_b1054 [Pseudoalteromonas citrea]|uniref:Uncharacterized protein n=1 Tax=Pseudoalteromonas citrea TaxID=43655 RepID=A0AAD4AFK2_9GAMM|nr:hypothetical protein PCIT_b1054 [Pseudoalteromonas citrea]
MYGTTPCQARLQKVPLRTFSIEARNDWQLNLGVKCLKALRLKI